MSDRKEKPLQGLGLIDGTEKPLQGLGLNDRKEKPLQGLGLNDGTEKPLQGLGLIFFIGFMGCGKSTKAKQLANKLECPVIDLDSEIVSATGKTIAEYFAEFGEEGFRNYESEMIKNFNYPETCVVATGGGLPCFFDNMDWMNAHGKTVYLQMEPAQLVSRLHKREKRPLIANMDDEQLLAFIKIKLAERNPFYNKAKVIVNAFDLDVDTLINELLI